MPRYRIIATITMRLEEEFDSDNAFEQTDDEWFLSKDEKELKNIVEMLATGSNLEFDASDIEIDELELITKEVKA